LDDLVHQFIRILFGGSPYYFGVKFLALDGINRRSHNALAIRRPPDSSEKVSIESISPLEVKPIIPDFSCLIFGREAQLKISFRDVVPRGFLLRLGKDSADIFAIR
jgi:hypothetical protein